MSCPDCRDIGIVPARHPRLLATVGVMVTLTLCPACDAGEKRIGAGTIEDAVMSGLALAYLPCLLCDGGITAEGDFCICALGREREVISKSASRMSRGRVPAKGKTNAT